MTATLDLATETKAILTELGVAADRYTGGTLAVTSPVTGAEIGRLREHSAAEAKAAIDKAHEAFLSWRAVPAPKRGELIRLLGEELRAGKAALGRLVSIEVGKITLRGPRRSAGNDRHLRFRSRPVAPALRPDHRHRALRTPDDGKLASAWRRSASSPPSISPSPSGRGMRHLPSSAAIPPSGSHRKRRR